MRLPNTMLTALLAALIQVIPLASAEEGKYVAPRGPGGKPDLNGTWQSWARANYDLEHHGAKAAMAFREGPVKPVPAKAVVALGAVGAVPAGIGVVVGGEIPYKPEARQKTSGQRIPVSRCFHCRFDQLNWIRIQLMWLAMSAAGGDLVKRGDLAI